MEHERFEILTRALQPDSSTRRALARFLVSLAIALGVKSRVNPPLAGKGKKRKRCNKRKHEQRLQCPAFCPDNCVVCTVRREGSPLCGTSNSYDCELPCASDNDCVGKRGTVADVPLPYCATGSTVTLLGGDLVPFDCPAACTAIVPCE